MPPSLPAPLEPTLTAHLFPGLGRELVQLLRSLDAEAWNRPTVCKGWAVRDIAAHLLDTAYRRLSFTRDRYLPPPPPGPVTEYGQLVGFLNGLNAVWVDACRRLSPRLLTDLMEEAEPQLAAVLAGLDPWDDAMFSVAWAGEERSKNWFDVARELTERWHHQQQIRLAVGAPPLTDPEWSEAVFDTFLRVLPHRYSGFAAPEGSSVVFAVQGARTYEYTLARKGETWQLLKGTTPEPEATLRIEEEPAWLFLTKGIPAEETRARVDVSGDAALVEPFFGALAVMA